MMCRMYVTPRAQQSCFWPVQGFQLGDSAPEPQRKTWQTFFAELDALAALERPWTLLLRDPLANSFVSSVAEDPRKDPRMQVGASVRLTNWCVLASLHAWSCVHQWVHEACV